MSKIKYKIFSKRKKFKIINWLEKSKTKTLESLTLFLKDKDVLPPSKEYFDKALKFFNENKISQEEPEAKEVKKETIPIEVSLPDVKEESVVEKSVVEEPVVEKPRTSRRRRKAKKNED